MIDTRPTRRARHLARYARKLGAVLVLSLVTSGVLLHSALPDLVRDRVARELESIGLGAAVFHVASVGFDRIRLTDVQLAADLGADAIEIEYGDPRALMEGHLLTVTVEGARWTVPLDAAAIARSTPATLARESGGGTGRDAPVIRFTSAHVTLEREGADPIELDGDADVRAGGARSVLVVRTPLGEHAIDVRATGDAAGLSVVASTTPVADPGATPLVLSLLMRHVDGDAVTWDLVGPVPASALALALPGLLPGADVQVVSRGSARRPTADTAWVIEDVEIDLDLSRAEVPALGASLEEISAELFASGALVDDVGIELRLDARSRVRIGQARSEDLRLERAELALPIRLSGDAQGAAQVHAAGAMTLSAETFALGRQGSSEARFTRTVLAIEEHGGRPLFENGAGSGRASLRFAGTARRVGGALRGHGVRVTGGVDAELAPEGAHVSVPLHLDIAAVRHPESEMSLAHARFDLPLEWNERGELRIDGRMRAAEMSWREVGLGDTGGAVSLVDDRLAFDWAGDATALADYRMRASIRLATGHTRVHVRVPASPVRAGDPLHDVLLEATGFEIAGLASCEVHVEPEAPGGGRARLTLDGAVLEDAQGRGAARGLGGTFALASIDPPASAAPDRVSFTELAIGDMVRTRDGSARVRLEPSGVIDIEDAVAELGGGQLHVAPFRFDPDDPEIAIALRLEGIQMERLVEMVARDRASASGIVDGNIALRLQVGGESRVVLGEGRLATRGPGLLRIPGSAGGEGAPHDLATLSDGQWIQERVMAALSDFAYSRMVFDVVHENGTSQLHAQVSGHGATTPQELDLNVNVDDLQLLLDESMQLLPPGRRAQPPT